MTKLVDTQLLIHGIEVSEVKLFLSKNIFKMIEGWVIDLIELVGQDSLSGYNLFGFEFLLLLCLFLLLLSDLVLLLLLLDFEL